ncbi:hypothetical protein [Microbacterium deminutum]|uniref:DUF998 domain-containing protein n=1 Tax=Microbacterium deminutum TaxID=344164 RepID=A0ABN2REA5_9MICO
MIEPERLTGDARDENEGVDMELASTSTQRTYRYVRLAIIGAVVAIFVSLIAYGTTFGWPTSISALFYTPGRTVFVGSLFAVTLGLLALSGHSLEQALLDLAAIFAPLIAIVPTVIATGDVPGLTVDCPGSPPCVPTAYVADVANGMVTFAIVGGAGVVVAVILALIQRTVSRALLATIAVAAAIVLGMTLWWALNPETFVPWGHLVATGAVLGLMAIVSVAAAAGAGGTSYRSLYLVIGVLFVLSLLFVTAVSVLNLAGVDLVAATGAPLILIGECIALALFAMFWLAQTAQKWDEVNPSII